MNEALIIAEHRLGQLQPITGQCVSAAKSLHVTPVVAVIGPSDVAAEAAKLSGVTQVLHVPAGEFESDGHTKALLEILNARTPGVILTGQTAQSMSFAPTVAARARLGLVTDVLKLSLDSECILAERPFYGGKVHGEIELTPGAAMVTLRPGEFPEADKCGSATIDVVSLDFGDVRTVHCGFEQSSAAGAGIEHAEVILSVGRGVGEEDNLQRFEELAKMLGAAFGVSRPIVDAGWMPASRQVGQSGKTVAPKVYIALGISGASQHLAGIKGADTVIAVNTDPRAGIFGVARFGAYCDMHELADELEELLG